MPARPFQVDRGVLQIVRAANEGSDTPGEQQQDLTRTFTSVGLFLLWAGFVGYVFLFSPNQTPFRDQLFLEKLAFINPSSTVDTGTIFYALFNLMGVYPALYSALLMPAGRSSNRVPTAPFLVLSFGLGMLALLPYFAAWAPLPAGERKLPPKSELGFFRKVLESRITAGVLLATSVYLIGCAAFAGGEQWKAYFQLFDESRFVHVTTIDFLFLTFFMPFWLVNDAEFRNSEYRDQAFFFALVPIIGPAAYLLLRPRSE